MKRLLLIITSILFFTTLIYPQSKVNKNNLVQYGDKWFKENDDKPYTGIVFEMSKETGNKILESKYVIGLLHGKHVEWYNDGKKKVEGIYKSGMMNGYWTFYHENGNVKSEGSYENGNGEKIERELGIPINGTVGKWTFWYENGQKKIEVNLKNGEPDGKGTVWYENGQKKGEGFSKDGKQDGLFTDWYENGKKKLERSYKGGKLDGLWTYWYGNGQKKIEQTFKNGTIDRLRTDWYENGQKKYEKYYTNGVGDGVWNEWDEDGRKTTELDFKDGMLIRSDLSVEGKKVKSMIVSNWEPEGSEGFYISINQNGSFELYENDVLNEGEGGIWYIIEKGDDIFFVTKESDVNKTVKGKIVFINNNKFEIHESRGIQILNRKK